jgi:FkbM family methyltransferase
MKIYLIIEILIKILSRYFPNYLSVYLGECGFNNLIQPSKKIKYIARLYDTDLKINVRNDYRIERSATKKYYNSQDVFNGLKKIDVKGFFVLDIGANVGTISLGLAALGAKKIYSFEPGPTYSRLLDNVILNNLSEKILTHTIGFGSELGELFWAEDKNNLGNAHLVKSIDSIDFSKITSKFNKSEFIKVNVTTVDLFLKNNQINKIDLIKIDVEGMEWDVVKGAKKIIEKDLPIIVAETHRGASDMMKYDCITPMFNYLYDLNYKSFSINKSGQLVEFIYPNLSIDTFFIHPNYHNKLQ